MTPARAELARRLADLQAELERTESVDPKAREMLEEVRREIATLLERSDESEQGSLRTRLETAIQHFEESHPVLTASMGRVMEQLSNLGI